MCLGCRIPLLYLFRDTNFSLGNMCLGCFFESPWTSLIPPPLPFEWLPGDFLYEFWWHDFNIIHMDLCGTLCTPGQVLEDSSLLGHKNIILLISSTEHQMLIWDSLLIKIYNPHIFLTLILDALQDSCKVTMYKIHCCNYCIFWSLLPV